MYNLNYLGLSDGIIKRELDKEKIITPLIQEYVEKAKGLSIVE